MMFIKYWTLIYEVPVHTAIIKPRMEYFSTWADAEAAADSRWVAFEAKWIQRQMGQIGWGAAPRLHCQSCAGRRTPTWGLQTAVCIQRQPLFHAKLPRRWDCTCCIRRSQSIGTQQLEKDYQTQGSGHIPKVQGGCGVGLVQLWACQLWWCFASGFDWHGDCRPGDPTGVAEFCEGRLWSSKIASARRLCRDSPPNLLGNVWFLCKKSQQGLDFQACFCSGRLCFQRILVIMSIISIIESYHIIMSYHHIIISFMFCLHWLWERISLEGRFQKFGVPDLFFWSRGFHFFGGTRCFYKTRKGPTPIIFWKPKGKFIYLLVDDRLGSKRW